MRTVQKGTEGVMRAKIGEYLSLWGGAGSVCSGPHKRLATAVANAKRCELAGGWRPHVIVRVVRRTRAK